ncbi:unnamed protein product [Heligmosomoides polygyrus]|uniref:Secreted protein n=1 Tax=Heligmosomoides polygyrus TaxID=6339 RepID=A0A183FET0_HELPZ|nr:unnamed protein product [Heligmosomoides polygyrus]
MMSLVAILARPPLTEPDSEHDLLGSPTSIAESSTDEHFTFRALSLNRMRIEPMPDTFFAGFGRDSKATVIFLFLKP